MASIFPRKSFVTGLRAHWTNCFGTLSSLGYCGFADDHFHSDTAFVKPDLNWIFLNVRPYKKELF
jgi:hypothetical protein